MPSRVDGVFLSDLEQSKIDPDLFRSRLFEGAGGLVSKQRESAYRSGRSDRWIKVKNRQHPASSRMAESVRLARRPSS